MQESIANMSQTDLVLYLFLVALFPITTALFCLGPRMSPKGTLFGVTVGEGERVPRLAGPIRAFYVRATLAVGAVAFCLALLPLALGSPEGEAFSLLGALLTAHTLA